MPNVAGKVVLINPKMCSPTSVRLPLSLLALGAVLEGRVPYHLVDGNMDPHLTDTVRRLLDESPTSVVGISVMPGPQVQPAIDIATAIRTSHPEVPIVWGGYFPTLYPDAALNAPYVDFVVRGQGELTLLELIQHLTSLDDSSNRDQVAPPIDQIAGLSWKKHGVIMHNADRGFRPPDSFPTFPYTKLGAVEPYLRPSFLGSRTAVHQAAIGCRYRCSFCGVVSMFDGHTTLSGPDRLHQALHTLQHTFHANAVQYYDHNFFDGEESSQAMLEVMQRFDLPWWCYARSDTLANFSERTWNAIEKSQLRMTYIGAEAGSDAVLRSMHKGTTTEHTFEVARRCVAHNVIPEFSFVLGGPEDPEGEIERTFSFIKQLKRIHPTCEIILYFYTPTPQRSPASRRATAPADRLPQMTDMGDHLPDLPTTPEEWTEERWIDFVCHRDAPWLTPRLRQRVRDFRKVVYTRFPTVQDYATPPWAKQMLRTLASWRYATGIYRNAWELDIARKLIPLREPQTEGL